MADTIINPYDSNSSKFRITEIAPEGQDTADNSQVLTDPIVWTVQGYSKPRETWKVKKHMRSSRTDYADLPVEQVLGVKYEPFTLSGVWDNRYNGGAAQDFAWNTKEMFEHLVTRGNLCEFAFDDITLTGLITDFEYEYFRRSYIGYTFTVSPHFGQNQPKRNAPNTAPSVTAFDQQVSNKIGDMQDVHDGAPQEYMVKGNPVLITGHISSPAAIGRSAYDQVSQYLENYNLISYNISQIIGNRVGFAPLNVVSGLIGAQTSQNIVQTGIQRLLQEFITLDSISAQTLAFMAATSPTTDLAYQDGTNVLNYMSWANGIKQAARQMLFISQQAQAQLIPLLNNDVLTIYRPTFQESLYDISFKFYGTTNLWRVIYSQNNLTSLVLVGDELLVIPKVAA